MRASLAVRQIDLAEGIKTGKCGAREGEGVESALGSFRYVALNLGERTKERRKESDQRE